MQGGGGGDLRYDEEDEAGGAAAELTRINNSSFVFSLIIAVFDTNAGWRWRRLGL